MDQKAGSFIPTRESLLSRIKDWGDERSWTEFFQTYRDLIFRTAIKSGLTKQEAEEVVQETLVSVAKTIKEFVYDPKKCRFKNWLGHLARKRIADCFRRRRKEALIEDASPQGTRTTAVLHEFPDPGGAALDAIWEEEWRTKVMEAAIQRVKNQVSPEHYQMFDFYVLRKMPVRKVAAALGTSAGQVYLAKHRIAKLLQKATGQLEEEMG
jgi:RNA polymerase sigma-70 factor (ECF subfamily)